MNKKNTKYKTPPQKQIEHWGYRLHATPNAQLMSFNTRFDPSAPLRASPLNAL
jgi:hypothetical protein